jgi:hypothetical protein
MLNPLAIVAIANILIIAASVFFGLRAFKK